MIIIPPDSPVYDDPTSFAKEAAKGVVIGIGIIVGAEIARGAIRRRWIAFKDDRKTNN